MRECFIPRSFKPEAARTIDQMNTIIDEYQDQGFTLRQARGLMPNTIKTYTYLATFSGTLASLTILDTLPD
jgi:hypothetical protein